MGMKNGMYVIEPGEKLPTGKPTGTQILDYIRTQQSPMTSYMQDVGIGAVALAPVAIPFLLAKLIGSAAAPAVSAAITPAVTAAIAPAAAAAAPAAASIASKGGLTKLLLAGGAGALVGSMLSGGIDQTQKAAQTTTVTPQQDTTQTQKSTIDTTLTGEVDTTATTTQDTKAVTDLTNIYEGSSFDLKDIRDFLFAPSTATHTTTQATPSLDFFSGLLNLTPVTQQQAAIPTQITIATPSQAQTQEATSMDTGLIALLAIGAIAVMFFLKRGKK